MPNISKMLEFYRLARNRLRSEADYIKFQQFQARIIINNIGKLVNLKGKTVLDIGCGFGGYSLEFVRNSAKVTSLDIVTPRINLPHFVNGDATNIPFDANTFDLVFSSSIIEHLDEPLMHIEECKRVLKKGGIFYLSFPPFYSPMGGHQFKPFHMFLPEKVVTDFARKFYGIKARRYSDACGNGIKEEHPLYIMTIRRVKRYIRQAGLRITKQNSRFIPLNLSKIPLLNEILTWHVEFYLKK